jgi:hypothetical protein
MSEDEEYSLEAEYYADWFGDYKDVLKDDFIEEYYSDEFQKYCKEQFDNWGDIRNE